MEITIALWRPRVGRSRKKKKKFNVVDNTGLLDLSEDELIDDDDFDRESIFQLNNTALTEQETESNSDICK